MKWMKWLLVAGVSIAIALFIAFRISYKAFDRSGMAGSYDPHCAKADQVCGVWSHFRQLHPYPYQSIAATTLPNGDVALIISEPSPSLSKEALDQIVRSTFGNDLVTAERLQWMIGADGWVEDLILRVKGGTIAKWDPGKDEDFLDRIGVLDRALFGTTFGGGFERIDARKGVAWTNTASNLDVSPREIREWLSKAAITWHPVDFDYGQTLSWASIASMGQTGTFESSDGSLVMLTFPTALVEKGRRDSLALESLKVPFRQFAVSSQSIFGGVWQTGGQTAVLARVRTSPVNELPPLRFETFALLAEQSSDELSQSYERNAIFAGKLQDGDYVYRDWAPVYLSRPLIDTEMGALLNITDQMLKSWSEAGNVEYLYFAYPKPKNFPFSNSPLSDVLHRKLKSKSVLFNWNTAGSAVIVRDQGFSILVARQTGALPVTYGANGKPTSAGGDNVYRYEDEAYKYFSGLHNPNLARVVQYTVLYQLFRAIAKDDVSSPQASASSELTPGAIPERAQAAAMMSQATANLLDDLDAGKLSDAHDLIDSEVRPQLSVVRQLLPGTSNLQLAKLLSDRFSPESIAYENKRTQFFIGREQEVSAAEKEFEKDWNALKQDAEIAQASASPDDMAIELKLPERLVSLKARRASLDAREDGLQKQEDNDPLGDLRHGLYRLAQEVSDLDAIRKTYISINQVRETLGSIRTPSIVLSWNRKKEMTSVGGHNLDSKAVRFEPSRDVSGISLESRNGVTVVRYNPSQADQVESNAGLIARQLEHGGANDTAALSKLAEESRPIRSPRDVLQVHPPSSNDDVFASIGTKAYSGKAPFVKDLGGIAEKNDCCVFIARDQKQTSYISERNEKAPPPVFTYEVRDTPSLIDFFANKSRNGKPKPIIFLDESEEHVKALMLNAGGDGDGRGIADIARLMGDERPNPKRVTGIVDVDLRGRKTTLEVWAEGLKDQHAKFLERFGLAEPASTWQSASVSSLDSNRVRQVLSGIAWDDTQDGIPTAIQVSFGKSNTQELSVVAGFSDAPNLTGVQPLVDAHGEAINLASRQPTSLLQYVMTLKNQLGSLPNSRLKRLLVISQEPGTTRTIVSQIEFPADGLFEVSGQ